MFRVVAGHTPIAAKTADYSGTPNESSYKSCCSCTRAQRKLNSQFFLRASTNRCVPLRSIIFFVPELNRKEVFFLERKKKRNEKQFVPTPGLEVWRKRDQRSAYSSAMPGKPPFFSRGFRRSGRVSGLRNGGMIEVHGGALFGGCPRTDA